MNPFALRAAVAISLVAPVAFAAQFKFPTQTFTVPDGFEVELVAGPPLVERPVSASFDDQGRLYVTDSSGSNEKPDKQLANPPHRVVRLEDADDDGRFEKSVVFADKVMFPQGCLWHEGSVYVAGPPSIWKFTDTDGDGVADKREEWWKGGTLTGCANDVHGPYLGPDGYLYWTKGAFAEQTHTLGSGRKLNDKAAHIYRARPDGSDLDVIVSGGMDNPVEVAFTPEGEAIFTSTFIDFSQPGYRDGIAHAVYGGVFGKQNDVLEDGRVKRTGPDLLHPFYEAGNAAECGLCRYESAVFGPDYRDNLFATTFNLHKVTRHVLRPSGATYASTDSDFVVSDSTDFHPTDVLEDADGSLLVVDTGGWYKLCCPSSQLAKPDLLGAIYRVRKHGAQKLPDSAKRSAYARVIKPSLDLTKAWVALKQAAMQRDSKAASVMRELLQEKIAAAATSNESARMARIAAEGLGRLGYRPAVPVLLHATGLTEDAIIEHSLTFALIEIADPALTRAGLKEENARTKRAALIALDQMDGSDLKPSDVIPSLNASDEHLRSAANWVVGHHPDWGGELAGFFRERLAAKNFKNSDRAELEKQLAQLAQDREIQELLGSVLRDPGFADEGWLIVLHAMARAGLKKTPSTWITALWPVVDTDNAVLVKEAVLTARALTLSKTNAMELIGTLSRVAHNAGWPPDVRLDALTALPAGLSSVEPDIFDFLRANLDAKKPPMLRAAAAEIIYRAKLNEEQLIELTDTLKIAGPLELSTLLGAFAHATSEAVGLRLVAALNESKGLAGLRVDLLKPLLEKFPATVQEQGQALLAKLNVDLEKQKAHLEELLASLPKGDIRRGQAIFNSPKTACASCHKIGYVGGLVGPDLTSIGQARTERDLLESVVYPSASFVRSYEPMVVATKSGDEYSGVIKKDAPDEIVLATGPNTEMRIARSDVTEMRPGTVSIMPQGLDEQISRQELADLVAFLKGTKWGAQ